MKERLRKSANKPKADSSVVRGETLMRGFQGKGPSTTHSTEDSPQASLSSLDGSHQRTVATGRACRPYQRRRVVQNAEVNMSVLQ